MVSFGLYYDFRALDRTPGALTRRWQGIVEQVAWAEALRGDAVDGVRVSPPPVRPGGPEVWIGALSPAAIDRAARLGDGFLCVLPDQIPLYVDARRRAGLDDGQVAVGNQWIVADDPER